jgi:hypothetical protein
MPSNTRKGGKISTDPIGKDVTKMATAKEGRKQAPKKAATATNLKKKVKAGDKSAPKKAATGTTPRKKATVKSATNDAGANTEKDARTPVERNNGPLPVLCQFDDFSSFIHHRGKLTATMQIRCHTVLKYYEADLKELEEIKAMNDKHLQPTSAPTKAEEVLAQISHVKPCIIKFSDGTAALHKLGKQFVEDRLMLMENDWVGEFEIVEENNAELAETMCKAYNSFANPPNPISARVLERVFGIKR